MNKLKSANRIGNKVLVFINTKNEWENEVLNVANSNGKLFMPKTNKQKISTQWMFTKMDKKVFEKCYLAFTIWN